MSYKLTTKTARRLLAMSDEVREMKSRAEDMLTNLRISEHEQERHLRGSILKLDKAADALYYASEAVQKLTQETKGGA